MVQARNEAHNQKAPLNAFMLLCYSLPGLPARAYALVDPVPAVERRTDGAGASKIHIRARNHGKLVFPYMLGTCLMHTGVVRGRDTNRRSFDEFFSPLDKRL